MINASVPLNGTAVRSLQGRAERVLAYFKWVDAHASRGRPTESVLVSPWFSKAGHGKVLVQMDIETAELIVDLLARKAAEQGQNGQYIPKP